MGKHADAIAAYPGPNIRPREPDDRMEAQMLSSILPCILEQNDFEEVYSDTCWQKMKRQAQRRRSRSCGMVMRRKRTLRRI